jgi:glycosyltransferase involved in cell wall biosynthesis
MTVEKTQRSCTVSVIMPAFNARDSIGRAIDSVLAQTRRPEEILVVDDGSTDGTREIVQRYGPPVRYLYQENAGAAQARNTGIQAARSEWISFLDADDLLEPVKIQVQMEILERNPDLAWCYGNYKVSHLDPPRVHLSHDPARAAVLLSGKEYFDDYLQAFAAGFAVHTNTLMASAESLRRIGCFDKSLPWGQDTDLGFRMAYVYPRCGYAQEPLAVNHFKQPGSITETHWYDITLRRDFLERHLKLSQAHNRQEGFAVCGRRLLDRWIRQMFEGGDRKALLEMVRQFSDFVPRRLRIETELRCRGPRFLSRWIDFYFWIKNKGKMALGRQEGNSVHGKS